MNVAARAFVQTRLTWEREQQWKSNISLRAIGIVLLLLAVLSSALSVIYVKASLRNLHNELQLVQKQRDHLQTEWSQLLLEQNTWAAPMRIQALAQQKLGMQFPHTKSTVILIQPD